MDTDLKGLRQRCEAWLGDLDLPYPFEVHAFCEALEAHRDRSILLWPVAFQGDPSGLWVAGLGADFICYEEHTTSLHQAQIALHEACHIVCGHHPIVLPESDVARLLFPDLGGEIFQHTLHRGSYSTVEECEAELLATLILESTADPRPTLAPVLNRKTATVLERHRMALEEQMEGDP